MENNQELDENIKLELDNIFNKQKEFYNNHIIDNVNYRIKKLKLLKKAIIEDEDRLAKALESDLGKKSTESYMCEIGMILEDLSYTIKHLKKWARDKQVLTPLAQFPSKSFIKKVSYGNILIMSPWNYPFLLSMGPLVGAIAAGNTVILRPSEYSPNISYAMKTLLKKVFEEEYVSVIIGDKREADHLLKKNFNYIFYTGSPRVGKIVMHEASEKLIPVTLELGGKSPCIVDNKSNYKLAAKRIIFGKLLNAGQTCVAPDYVLVNKEIKDDFIKYLVEYLKEFLGDDILANEEFPRIANIRNYTRLSNIIETLKEIENSKSKDKIKLKIYGGNINKDIMKIEPTIVDLSKYNCIKDKEKIEELQIMQEEIFGPILPVISYNDIDEAIDYINNRERPLAFYLFTNRKEVENKVFTKVRFGGGCINDTIIHLANPKLPFGGVGNSGMGNYHGRFGFNTFSHDVSVVKKSTLIDLPMRYHPYTKINDKIIKMFMK